MYEQALELRPDLPEARVGAAADRVANGKLEEASELLDFLAQPGAGQLYDLLPLDQLAFAYQRQGNHQKTIEICEHLIAEFPDAAQQYRFREFVRTSEKAVGSKTSVLPKKEFSLKAMLQPSSGRYSPGARWGLIGTVVAVFIVIGLLINNEYHRRHRTLHVVNGFETPVRVKVGDQEPVTIQTRGRITLREGDYDVQVSGPIEETLELQLETPYFQRWTRKPAWVLNPGGAAALSRERIVYSEFAGPAAVQLLIGKRFIFVPHVDYLFEKPPNQMQVSRGGSITKISLQETPAKPVDVFRYALRERSYEQAFEFAETHLTVRRDDQPFLTEYAAALEKLGKRERAITFLEGKLWEEPLSIPWHRTYQNIAPAEACEGPLLDRYEEALKSETTAALLYLRGRVSPDRDVERDSMRRAHEAAPKLGWPSFALGYELASQADWAAARVYLDETHAIDPFEAQWEDMRYLVRLAQGETDKLLEESQGQDRKILLYYEALVASEQLDDAAAAEAAWLQRLPSAARHDPAIRTIQQRMLYMRGGLRTSGFLGTVLQSPRGIRAGQTRRGCRGVADAT